MQRPVEILFGNNVSSSMIDETFEVFEQQRETLEKEQSKQELEQISKKMGKLNLNHLSPAALDDARMVNRIDEDFKRLNAYLVKTKNVCTFSEYKNKWIAVHELIYPEMPDYEHKVQERRSISAEYMDRFITTEAIKIVDDYDHEKVLVTIPPQFLPINTIQGKASQIIDMFTHHSNTDQEHLLNQSGSLLSRVMAASVMQYTPEMIRQMRLACFKANIEILKLFNPEHPLLKQMEDTLKKHQEVNKNIPKLENIKQEDKVDNNVIDDDSNFNFF